MWRRTRGPYHQRQTTARQDRTVGTGATPPRLEAPGNDAIETETEPTLKDVMSLLMSINSKFDNLKTAMNKLKESYSNLKAKVENMQKGMSELTTESNSLKTQHQED